MIRHPPITTRTDTRCPHTTLFRSVELMERQARPEIREELNRNIVELDQLIDEILLASRLDAITDTGTDVTEAFEQVDLTALVAEECARIGAEITPEMTARAIDLHGDPRILHRMVATLQGKTPP